MAKFKVYVNTYQQGQLVKRNILHIASDVHPEEKVKIQNYAKTRITEDDANRLRKLQHNIPLEVLMSITKAMHPLIEYLNDNFTGVRNGVVNGATFSFAGLTPYQNYTKYVIEIAEKIKAKYQVLQDLAESGAAKGSLQASARNINAEIQELMTLLNDRLAKLTNIIFRNKMKKFYRTLNSNKRAIKLAKEGALVESVEDMKYLKYASRATKVVAGVGVAFTFAANYYGAYNNIEHGANCKREIFKATSKSAAELVISGLAITGALALAPVTGGLSLIIIAGAAGVIGSTAGDYIVDHWLMPWMDNAKKAPAKHDINMAYMNMRMADSFS